MVRHICMFKIKEDDREEKLAKFLELTGELRQIEEIAAFDVVCNSPDAPQSNYDVSLVFDFASLDDLEAYSVSPVHKRFKENIADLKTGRACIDYEF